MSREIIAIRTKRPVYLEDVMVFQVGHQLPNGQTTENITRSIGGLSDVSSAGPATLGPNCPTFVVTLSINKKLTRVAVPERLVDSVVFKDVKKGSKDDSDITMSKEG